MNIINFKVMGFGPIDHSILIMKYGKYFDVYYTVNFSFRTEIQLLVEIKYYLTKKSFKE